MQRKAYVSGTVALLAALLAGCTGGSDGGTTDDSNPGGSGTASPAAQPGRYRTLPEPCSAVGEDSLDSLLPGIAEITDEEQRARAYEGEATLTYDNDRKVGCRWKVDSADATDHLFVDLERVVSYDNSVSDDSQARELFATKTEDADLPEPITTETETRTQSETGTGAGDRPASGTPSPTGSPTASASPSSGTSGASATAPSSGGASSATAGATPTALQPRLLDGLGDEAFLDDELSSSGSTAQRRTVTVAFRTSNVIVTVEYTEQPAVLGVVPDSEEMQDKARKLASRLADSLGG
ncbi:DUF3558 domain-containing protein [Streptomyces griseoviridis]|uniref:DUF3558 domain-containing protein n=2 Tax=Streptomyces griseoviridis TaxID=45398 RepID=A0ABT9LI30_STRGD|nr:MULTISPECIES: DUF3558 domain-containing protein [Streptomyces]MDP9683350.1 hypothetical protein [Streptomyces griseoviridis]GGS54271.1 hypothetical protein GCM10010238_49550 [Streptomyces niveoruber]GGT23962.1 hypothetical protein GCM10010240_65710 [Streptomyces griseoviridis]